MAEREGADGVSIITPYFISPNQQEIFDHYRRIAEHLADRAWLNAVRVEIATSGRAATPGEQVRQYIQELNRNRQRDGPKNQCAI